MSGNLNSVVLACLAVGLEFGLIHSAKVADADGGAWVRKQTAESAFCPYMSAASRMNGGVIDALRQLSNMSYTALSEKTGQKAEKRKHQWVLGDAKPKVQLQHLFAGDGGFLAGTCAVVSSSGVLLSHRHGSEIDSADLVWRFNDAEVDPSMADFVGLREDIRVLNDLHSDYLLYPGHKTVNVSTDSLILMQRQRGGSGIAPKRLMQILHTQHPLGNFVQGERYVNVVAQQVMNDAFGQPDKGWNVEMSRHLTTGFQGILTAATLCKEVRTYGFVSSPQAGSVPYHYYGEKAGTANDKGKHATYDEEKDFWRMIATNSDIDATDKAVFPGFPALKCGPERSTALLQLF